ncbi:MAG: hypothetical protein KatS3mg031_2141 [Chitinophagales bacterium]|nr:MAG: hypothetical protein KatS3mg031_2141 [Chitinophagales bacterium]
MRHNLLLSWAAILMALVIFSGCSSLPYLMRHTVPEISDVNIFPTHVIQKPEDTYTFAKIENEALPDAAAWALGKTPAPGMSLEEFLEKTGTTAFLFIRNDTIIYENYFHGYSREKLSQVFSITKSVMSALVGIAIDEGYIQSIHQPVSDFIPEFAERGHNRLTLNHLLQMTAGLAFADYQTPAKLLNMYYSPDQEAIIKRIKQKYPPGTRFAYSSAATQILGMCLERAVGKKVVEYLEEKLWKPLGMEYDAKFALERPDGDAKMYGGLAAAAIDLAKLGRLYLHNGNWNGTQLISEGWVKASRVADTIEGRSKRYAYCWWLDTYLRRIGYCDDDFFAGGYRGQTLYVNPDDNIIIVRLGLRESGIEWPQSLSKLAFVMECSNNQCAPPDLMALEGKYKSQTGKAVGLKLLNDILVLEDYDAQERIELQRDTPNRFIGRQKDKEFRILIDVKNEQVKGVFVEGRDKQMFFRKI